MPTDKTIRWSLGNESLEENLCILRVQPVQPSMWAGPER